MRKNDINFDTVAYLEAETNYTKIYFYDCKNAIFPRTLKRFEEDLTENKNFIRINRSTIVNIKFIMQAEDEYEIKMNCGKVIPISRRRKALFGIENFRQLSQNLGLIKAAPRRARQPPRSWLAKPARGV